MATVEKQLSVNLYLEDISCAAQFAVSLHLLGDRIHHPATFSALSALNDINPK